MTSALPLDKREAFFALLRPAHRGLGKVRRAVRAADYDAAAQELHAYFLRRKKPVYFRGWERRVRDKSYSTKKADEICRHLIHGYQWGKKVRWHDDPRNDLEFPCTMSRHDFLNTLGEAYWHTGKEKYAAKFVELITDWIKENPIVDYMAWYHTGHDFLKCVEWEPINAGIRLYGSWIHCLHYFRHSRHLTPDVFVTILNSIWEQAHFIRMFSSRLVHRGSNWNLMDNAGMAIAGIMFPEFEEADQWRKLGLVRIDEQIHLQFSDSGVHDELCAGYHLVSLFSALMPLELALRNGHELPHTYGREPDALEKLEKATEFVANLLTPNGQLPMIGDGDVSDLRTDEATYGIYEDINNMNILEDRNDLRAVFRIAGRMFNRPDFLYLGTGGREGRRPAARSVLFPDAGYSIMRDVAGEKGKYLFFEAGRQGGVRATVGHSHADALQVVVGAYGELMLVDPGRYEYETTPVSRYLVSSKAHNTLVVDDLSSSEPTDRWWFSNLAVGMMNRWVTSPDFDYAEGSHDGYERLKRPVTHLRKVLFVKGEYWIVADFIVGDGNHSYDLYYHLGKSRPKLDARSQSMNATFDNGSGLLLLPGGTRKLRGRIFTGSKKPVLGWYSPYYGVLEKTPTVRYSALGSAPVSFATVIYPYSGKRPDLDVKIGPLAGNPLDLAIEIVSAKFADSTRFSLLAGTPRTVGSCRSDGVLSFFRRDRRSGDSKVCLVGADTLSVDVREELRGLEGRAVVFSRTRKAVNCYHPFENISEHGQIGTLGRT